MKRAEFKYKKTSKIVFLFFSFIWPILFSSSVLAASNSVSQVESFIKSLIDAVAGLAGLIASGFFVVGGLRYITSSGNPQHLDRAKRTIIYSAAGLAITIGAYVISNIIGGLASSAFNG